MGKGRVKESKHGRITLNMRESGETTKPMGEEFSITQMGMSTMANGLMIKLVALGHTLIVMEVSMLESGKKTNNGGKANRHG